MTNIELVDNFVNLRIMYPEQNFILEITPKNKDISLDKWCENNLRFINNAILKYCGIVFREFNSTNIEFKKISDIISKTDSLSYTAGIAPRENYGNGIYLSTTIDKRCELPQHHEMAYFRNWPMKIFFYCEEPSISGGETTLVSSRTFGQRLDPKIMKRFEEKEVSYVRNYIAGINSTWQQSYNTSDKIKVEQICKQMNFDYSWNGDNLRTKNIAQGTAIHPITKEKVWHNHAHVYNLFCGKKGELTPTLKLTKHAYKPEYLDFLMTLNHLELPTNTYYGNGDIIESDIIEEVSQLFLDLKVGFLWKKGDFMVLDNMLCFHGKNPHEGDNRKILTILKESYPIKIKKATLIGSF